jgi:hypothetical protein
MIGKPLPGRHCNQEVILKQSAALALLLLTCSTVAADETATDTRPGLAPDIREDESAIKVQRGNFVAVPIPISNPTLDTGLVAGAAYFYPQSEEEKNRQPASLTAVAGMYTSNDSRALGVAQQNYWKNDQWRFTGVVGAVDLRLSLLAPDDTGRGSNVDWRIDGNLLYSKLSRRLKGDWYGGAFVRVIDANQSIDREIGDDETQFEIGDATSAGVGLVAEYDSRDMPLNSYTGRHLKIDALFNDEAIGSNQTYQSYGLSYRSYHRITDSVVLAWEIQGCKRGGKVPLWDACLVKLRGFSATDYLGRVSASGQIEVRWQMSSRWGLAGFAGSGYVGDSFAGVREREPIPSYGAGVRFVVLPAKRINMRLDYARSKDSNAIHFSVGEAF